MECEELVDVEVPVGAVLPYAGPINACTRQRLAERGWLVCDGARLYAARYPELYVAIRRLYGYPPEDAESAGIFCLPDYRGVFLRGLDRGSGMDREAESRTFANANGSGNQKDQVGSRQGQAFQEHEHTYTIAFTTPPVPPPSGPGVLGLLGDAQPTLMTGSTSTSAIADGPDTSELETRPVNIAVNFLIKAESKVRSARGPSGCGDTKDSW